jgi:hypothetical protein
MRTLLALVLATTVAAAAAQTDTTGQAAKLEQQRAQSGVDPTRVMSRAAFSPYMTDPTGDAVGFTTRLRYTMGMGRWSLGVRQEFISDHSGVEGSGFQTGRGDMRLSVLNAFLVRERVALAASVDLDLPTGGKGFSTPAAVMSPALTFSYTIKPTLIFATQPQYTFAPVKDAIVPEVSTLTVRSFLAAFRPSGWFYVFEPRPIFDLANDKTSFVIAPILGKNLAKGYSWVILMEFPTDQYYQGIRGNLYQVGMTKNF